MLDLQKLEVFCHFVSHLRTFSISFKDLKFLNLRHPKILHLFSIEFLTN